MKTIVLFHRLDLTDLYIDLSRELAGRMKIVHLAYSDSEVRRLEAASVEGPIIHFKDAVREICEGLDTPDPELLRQIDRAILEQTGGAFTLNGVIQSDRGFVSLSNEECLRLAAAYYLFWTAFLEDHDVDHILHETPSLVFNFIGVIACGARGGQYIYNVMVPSEPGRFDYLTMHGFDFTCSDLDHALAAVRRGEIPVDADRCKAFLADYRKDLSVFLGSSVSRNARPSRLIAATARNFARRLLRRSRYDKYIDNIDHWELRRDLAGQKIVNLLQYRAQVRFDAFDPSVPYYFYPFQLEPEAGVHYQGHGLYMNQVKLIQNIAAQLPPGAVLYVKDHPHDHGYRAAIDYLRLNHVPNIRLLHSHIPAKQVIAGAKGVMTITGTAGFEAALMGKSVYCFGKTFYSDCPQVTYIRNIRDLREAVYANEDRRYRDEEALYPFLTAFMAAKKEGLIDYYGGRASRYGIDLAENSRTIASSLLDRLNGT